ncbi:uncharacterized protein TNCV_3600491 [Trichonephila clavipes]|nr:uncharacterized protein TNCV_3600491 [Trichonephila clavipes]
MSDGLRHRFSVETNNLPNFNRGTVYDQRFRDYERLLDANNYESMSEIDLTRLNSEQHFGETNFPEYYPRNTTDTSFIEPSNSNFLPPNENTPLLEPTQPGPNSSGSSGGGRSSTSGTLSGIGNAINTALPVGKTGLFVTGSTLATGVGPLNPMPIGAARDKADQIAKVHDDAYVKASYNVPQNLSVADQEKEFKSLIEKSDARAIKVSRSLLGRRRYKEFNRSWWFNNTPPAEVPPAEPVVSQPEVPSPGGESIFDQPEPIDVDMSPVTSGQKQKATREAEGAPAAKQAATEQPATPAATRTGQLPGTGENFNNVSASGVGRTVMVPRPFPSRQVHFRTYKKFTGF